MKNFTQINQSFTFLTLFLFFIVFSCSENSSKSEEGKPVMEDKEPKVTMLWKTDSIFTGSESTLFHNGTIYVSNGNTKPSEKDGNGFISKLNEDGTVDSEKWVEGLSAPKGMAILNDQLFVTDIDEVVIINLSDGSIEKKLPVENAQFLNDAATDGTFVFFSDMRDAKIYKTDGEKIILVASDVPSINGVEIYNGRIYGLNGEGLISFNENGTYDIINDEVKGGDGLVIINDSTFIASRWAGQIFYIKGNKTTLLLDTQEEKSNTADIGFIPTKNTITVPTFMKNEVAAYELSFE
ncbi:hypothetical protein [Membranihabitans maritimus]|uniref:hypothetical protein n=1 Tax=Membranihabitans maritimus TaxID=2904244 RepID=UPI001F1EEB9A|nr:hypothetical protein [Membranihabitans maritimus]